MIQLVEVCELLTASKNAKQRFTLREIYVNPKHIISLREDSNFERKLSEGVLPPELDGRQRFTRLTIDKGNAGLEIVVVGTPGAVAEKMRSTDRGLLQG